MSDDEKKIWECLKLILEIMYIYFQYPVYLLLNYNMIYSNKFSKVPLVGVHQLLTKDKKLCNKSKIVL